MTLETFEKARSIVGEREEIKRKLKELSEVKNKLRFGRLSFSTTANPTIILDTPLEIKENFIQETIDWYKKRLDEINATFRAL